MSDHSHTKSKKIFRKGLFWSIMIIAGVVVGISYATINANFYEKSVLEGPSYEVQQGPLTISLSVKGTINAREKVIIKSDLEGSNAILYIVPEGTRAKKGDLLVELDASALKDNRVEQQIRCQNAEAYFLNAKENFEIVKSMASTETDQAKLRADFAKLDRDKYLNGEFPNLQKDAESKIKLNEEELNRATEKLKWSNILFKEKYLSQTELQQDELVEKRAQLNVDLSRNSLKLLNDYTYKRQIASLESEVVQSDRAFDRVQRRASANIVQASVELQARKSEHEHQMAKLQKIEDQIAKAKIIAPMDGLVLYATTVRQDWHSNEEPLKEGRLVHEREELIHLPTTASYVAEVKIHESNLEKIRLGMPVQISVDALPGKTYTGHVATIAPLPDSQSIYMNPDLKVYNTEVYIDSDDPEFRSGMNCKSEIIIDQFKDTLYIPVQAVLRIAGRPTVYVAKGNQWEQRIVELGPDNNSQAQIKSGLKKGEFVWLTPPLSAAEVPADKEWKGGTDTIRDKAAKETGKNESASGVKPNSALKVEKDTKKPEMKPKPEEDKQKQGKE